MEEFDDKDYSNMEEEFTYVNLAFLEDRRRDKRIGELEASVAELKERVDLLEEELAFLCRIIHLR